MADLQINALRDALRSLRSDLESLRRRTASGTLVTGTVTLVTSVGDGSYPLSAASIQYARMGDMVFTVPTELVLGVPSAGTGQMLLNLPVPPLNAAGTYGVVGLVDLQDDSEASYNMRSVWLASGVFYMRRDTGVFASPTSPFIWAVNDRIVVGSLVYPAAP